MKFKFQNVLENYKLALLIAIFTVGLLFVCNLSLIVGWHLSEQKVRVFIPPQVPTSGLTMTANDVPAASVFSFAYYVWQNLNDWSSDGAEDYPANLTKFSPFLTPNFHHELTMDFQKRFQAGEVQHRLRNLLGVSGSLYVPSDVEYVGHGTWLVHLVMHLSERVKDNDAPVKDIQMSYTLRVVSYDVSGTQNQWGLALDGFSGEPERIETAV